MTLDDVPAVMAIERLSFPRPWPERAYRYELIENPSAYFIVARSRQDFDAASQNTGILAQVSRFSWLRSLLSARETMAVAARHAHRQIVSLTVGFAGMWIYVDEAHIATLATHPNWRGRGIGEALLIDLIREAQRRHALSATLEVRLSNHIAQNLYRKYGLEEAGRRKSYYQDNREDALIMTVNGILDPTYCTRLNALEKRLEARAWEDG